VHHIARVQQSAVVKANAPSQVKQISAPVWRNVPPGGQCWPDLRVRAEARESVEEVGDRATRRNIGGERRVERFWIVAVACVDERATMRGFTAATRSQSEECNECQVRP
jgi:hypothetical protein